MNASTDAPVLSPAAKPVFKLEEYARQHPGGALLVAAGLGLAVVLVARALTPAPPKNRAVRLLEDIQHRLADLAHLGFDRVSSLAEDGSHAVSKGVETLGTLHLDRKFDKLSRGIKSLFH